MYTAPGQKFAPPLLKLQSMLDAMVRAAENRIYGISADAAWVERGDVGGRRRSTLARQIARAKMAYLIQLHGGGRGGGCALLRRRGMPHFAVRGRNFKPLFSGLSAIFLRPRKIPR
jgi:hypothetical protein